MKKKNPNRQGFYNHLNTIRGVEKDKDAFCKAARIPRGGCDVFNNLDAIICDLTRRRARGDIFGNEYFGALDRIKTIIAEQNEHEYRMAKIEAGLAPESKE